MSLKFMMVAHLKHCTAEPVSVNGEIINRKDEDITRAKENEISLEERARNGSGKITGLETSMLQYKKQLNEAQIQIENFQKKVDEKETVIAETNAKLRSVATHIDKINVIKIKWQKN